MRGALRRPPHCFVLSVAVHLSSLRDAESEACLLSTYKKPIRKLRDLHDAIEELGDIRWIFRGEGNYKDPTRIESSIERFFDREGTSAEGDKRRKIEDELIREFKRAYHQYAYHLPAP